MNKEFNNILKKENLLIIIAIACFLLYYYRRELKESPLFQDLTKQLPKLIVLLSFLQTLVSFVYDDEEKHKIKN